MGKRTVFVQTKGLAARRKKSIAMNRSFYIYTSLTILVVNIILKIAYIENPAKSLAELSKCPFCYGQDLCPSILNDEVVFDYSFLFSIVRFFSTKNVFFGKFKNKKVVIKKLGHNAEWYDFDNYSTKFDSDSFTRDIALQVQVSDESRHFYMCNQETVSKFIKRLLEAGFSQQEIFTIVHMNVEPALLGLFKSEKSWAVPKLYGACGRIVVEEHCGHTLNYFKDHSWRARAVIALRLAEAVYSFTFNHEDFVLYLIDISPDNIAVDKNLNPSFIDMESAILRSREYTSEYVKYHKSEWFPDSADYEFSVDAVCQYEISDHNIYFLCKLILSEDAPWPMMKGGLLHSQPNDEEYLSTLIESCVRPNKKTSRFEILSHIVTFLKKSLHK